MDSREPAQWHGLGSLSSQTWSLRTDGKTGFQLAFPKGGEDIPWPPKVSHIKYLCNPATPGLGIFGVGDPTEQPLHEYHLTFETKYACPVQVECAMTMGDWIGIWDGLILQFTFSNNGTAKLKIIQSDCVYHLVGYYNYQMVPNMKGGKAATPTFLYYPSSCSGKSNPPNCDECTVVLVNSQPLVWETTNCRAFSVVVNRGQQSALVKFQYATLGKK